MRFVLLLFLPKAVNRSNIIKVFVTLLQVVLDYRLIFWQISLLVEQMGKTRHSDARELRAPAS